MTIASPQPEKGESLVSADLVNYVFVAERIASTMILLASAYLSLKAIHRIYRRESAFMERAWRPLLLGIVVLALAQIVSAFGQITDTDLVRVTSAGLVLASSLLIYQGMIRVIRAWRRLGARV
jgi:FtsH-binding integral membrane protein